MATPTFKVPVSVLIPAKNEEQNLPACLASLERAEEVFVVDSYSSDRSVEIATAAGAKVVQLGFLDGRAGYIYGRLLSQYEYQIGVKLFELRQFDGQLNVAAPAEPSPLPPPRSTSSMVSSRGN
jgi:glycosyltransferase involved in cell wall biosynthesis